MAGLSQFDEQLLGRIQRSVPLVERPFAQLAAELGGDEAQLLRRIERLRREPRVIRQISGIFDAVRLGYTQALVALALAGDKLDAAGALIARHPGVSHCYSREGDWNLWFTLAVSPRSTLGLEKTVQTLARTGGADNFLLLPMLRKYKLKVHFGSGKANDEPPDGDSTNGVSAAVGSTSSAAPTDRQILAIRLLERDLPTEPQPFAALAAGSEFSAADLLVQAADFLAQGTMRRYAAVLHHRAAGAAANVMAVWRVDESRADAAGAIVARIPQVSHCYLRPASAEWPYNFYTMIHGATEQACRDTIAQIAARTGLADHAELWTKQEYKKQRLQLFSDVEQAWEAEIR